MQGRGFLTALAIVVACSGAFPAQARADEPKKKTTTEEEIEASKATLAEGAAAAPALERGAPPKKRSIVPWILGGAGVAGIVTGGIFTMISLSDQDKADDFKSLAARSANVNERNDLQSSARSSEDAADRELMIAAIAAGAGITLLTIAIIWAVADSPSSGTPSARITPAGFTATF